MTNVKKERKAPEATITAILPVEDHVYSTGWQARPYNRKNVYKDAFVIDLVVCHLQIRSADLNLFGIKYHHSGKEMLKLRCLDKEIKMESS